MNKIKQNKNDREKHKKHTNTSFRPYIFAGSIVAGRALPAIKNRKCSKK